MLLFTGCAVSASMVIVCPICDLSRATKLPDSCGHIQRLHYLMMTCSFLAFLTLHLLRERSLLAPWTALRGLAVCNGIIQCAFVLLLAHQAAGLAPDVQIYPPGLQFQPALLLGGCMALVGGCLTPALRASVSGRLRRVVAEVVGCPARGATAHPDAFDEESVALLDLKDDRKVWRAGRAIGPAAAAEDSQNPETEAAYRQWRHTCEEELGDRQLCSACGSKQEAMLWCAFEQLDAARRTLSEVEEARRVALVSAAIAEYRKSSSTPSVALSSSHEDTHPDEHCTVP